jgi:prepilin peptidase CpaA
MLITAAILLYGLALLAATVSDLTRYEIPNRVSLAVVAAFALTLPELPIWTSLAHISAALVLFAAGTALFVANIWGGGDVKLLAATTLWTGWSGLASFLLLTAIAGALLAIILLVLRHYIPAAPAGRWYSRLLTRSEGIPYGVAIAAAAGLALLLPAESAPVLLAMN